MRGLGVVAAEQEWPKVQVREIMSNPVITVKEADTVADAAALMREHDIGCVIVTDGDGKPVGILTERDIARRVAAEGLCPGDVRVRDVMSSPLMTIDPDVDVVEAVRMMTRLKVSRLGVVYKDRLVGIVSYKDIMRVIPEIFYLASEIARTGPIPAGGGPLLAGYCDGCGRWSRDLKEVEGRFLCEECRIEAEEAG